MDSNFYRRFPLGSPAGLVHVTSDDPSGSVTRPFGMRYAVTPSIVECGKHEKPRTRNNRTKKTQFSKDSKLVSDTETYIEYD